ncbi:MAG: hypothetical protein AVDCRST_MAG67-1277, partial [uncultured Solirubrobacteraceae bacterium]
CGGCTSCPAGCRRAGRLALPYVVEKVRGARLAVLVIAIALAGCA